MLIFILGIIFGILIILSIIIYYKKVKRVRAIGDLKLVNNSILCLIVYIVNRIRKDNFVAIVNAFNSRVHILNITYFEGLNEDDLLYKHELVHLYQIKEIGRFKFIILYLFYSIRYGYRKNPFEVEAYRLEVKTADEIKKKFGLFVENRK